MKHVAMGGTLEKPGSLPAPSRGGTRRWTGNGLAVAGLTIVLFVGGGLGVFTAVRPDTGQPAAAAHGSAPVLQSRPAVEAGVLARLIGDLQARIEVVPDDWNALASLGMAFVQQARVTGDPAYYPRAEEALARSLDLNGDDNVTAMIGMGALSLARHDFADALEWGERARVVNGDLAAVYGVMGDALVELGRYEDGFGAFQQMVDRRPDLSSYARASYALELQGDVEAAIELMERAFNAAGTPGDAAWTLYQLGDLWFSAGRIDRAEANFRRALAADSASLPARAGLGKVAAARGRLHEAISILDEVVAAQPLPEHVIALADLYTAIGDEEGAARQFELLEAERALLEANGVNVDLEFALFSADHGVGLAEGLAAARAEWNRRTSVHVADALAWQLYANGRHHEALEMADEALRLGTRSALFHFHRGMIELTLGMDAAARRDLAKALEINPHFSVLWADEARRLLEEVGG
jgi:tetratricopeptide (TPR) repeat protein